MPIPEAFFLWTLTSSGASTTVYGESRELRGCRNITFNAHAVGSGDTAVIGLESAVDSTSKFDRVGSTAYSLSSNGAATIQFSGPMSVVRPYVIAKTNSTTVVVIQLLGN